MDDDARYALKKRYRKLIGIGLGGAGVAAALTGMPMTLTFCLWGLSFVSWKVLEAV